MPRQTSARAQSTATPPAPASVPSASALTEDEIQRWAHLIADGQVAFPADLSPSDQVPLQAEVRRRRRDRLIRQLARVLALSLWRGSCP